MVEKSLSCDKRKKKKFISFGAKTAMPKACSGFLSCHGKEEDMNV